MTLGFSRGSAGPGGGGIDALRRVRDTAARSGHGGQPAMRATRWLALALLGMVLGLAGLASTPPESGTGTLAPSTPDAAIPAVAAHLGD